MDPNLCPSLTDVMLHPANLAIVTGASIVLITLARAVPELVATSWWPRLQPLMALLICTAALWLPGVADARMSLGDRGWLGLLLGLLADRIYEILLTGLGLQHGKTSCAGCVEMRLLQPGMRDRRRARQAGSSDEQDRFNARERER